MVVRERTVKLWGWKQSSTPNRWEQEVVGIGYIIVDYLPDEGYLWGAIGFDGVPLFNTEWYKPEPERTWGNSLVPTFLEAAYEAVQWACLSLQYDNV